MFLRIRVPAKPAKETPITQSGAYPIRPTSLIASVGLHGVAILGLFLVSPDQPVSDRPILDQLIQPDKHKIIYYDFRKKPEDVEPVKRTGKSPQPSGRELSQQTVIATAPKAKSTQQMIWLPAPKIEIHEDVPTPNMIARMNTSIPSLPAPPRENPRPAVEAAKAVPPNNSPPDPKGDTNHAPESPNNAANPPKQARAFVPPPPSVREPKLALPTLISEAPAPAISSPTMTSRLPAGAGMPVLQVGAPPPPSTAPVAPIANPGNARVDIAVASLHPVEDAKNNVPEGERPGRFAKAPEKGAPATGEIGKTATLTVPNLTIREDKPKPVKVLPDPNSRAILYAERVRTIPLSTLSVPLRPSSRTIPRTVEARFQGRSVYTMVVPIENLPAYSGDWIVWFAERQPVPGETPLMRAPLPYRKMEPVDQKAGNTTAERVQISAILEKDGRLGKIAVSTKAGTDTEQAVLQDLESWEFKPATRDGVPIDVEVVIEITFNLPSVARRGQP